jgi:hypothetical protein
MSARTKQKPIRGEMVRTLDSIQIGAALAMQKKRDRDDELAMHEIDLQYQLPINGIATSIIGWGTIEIEFEWEFHYAPANRDSRLVFPHMTYGAYVPPPAPPIAVLACVTDWMIDPDTNAIVGAIIAVGAFASVAPPTTTDGSSDTPAEQGVTWKGHLHVSFQGWAMGRDDFSDTPDLESGDDT